MVRTQIFKSKYVPNHTTVVTQLTFHILLNPVKKLAGRGEITIK